MLCVVAAIVGVLLAVLMSKSTAKPAVICRQCQVKGQVKTSRHRHHGHWVEEASCGNCGCTYTL